jgi:hypothetical protein
MGEDGGDARPDAFALDDRDVPHADAVHVSEGVELPGPEDAELQAEVAEAGPLLGRGRRDGGGRGEVHEERDYQKKPHRVNPPSIVGPRNGDAAMITVEHTIWVPYPRARLVSQ